MFQYSIHENFQNYCSNYCYRASIHIKNQIDSSPLWSRNHAEIKRFTLLDKLEKLVCGKRKKLFKSKEY